MLNKDKFYRLLRQQGLSPHRINTLWVFEKRYEQRFPARSDAEWERAILSALQWQYVPSGMIQLRPFAGGLPK